MADIQKVTGRINESKDLESNIILRIIKGMVIMGFSLFAIFIGIGLSFTIIGAV